MFRAAIFTLDGTLVDSLPSTTAAFNAVVAPHLGTSLSEGEVRGISGPVNESLLSKFVPEEAVAPSVQALRQSLVEAAGRVQAYPGIKTLLEKLTEQNIKLALFTVRDRQWTEAVVHGTDLGRYFRSVVTADDGAKPFPDPSGIEKAASQLASEPAETLFVTDHELEVQMARKAGFLTAAVAWGYSQPDRLLAAQPDVLFEDLATLG